MKTITSTLSHRRKIYDLVKEILTDYPETRDSDKKLIWNVWDELDFIDQSEYNCIHYEDFMNAPSTESIRRCRQKIQEKNPELRGSKKVQEYRKIKQETKSTFVYREQIGLV